MMKLGGVAFLAFVLLAGCASKAPLPVVQPPAQWEQTFDYPVAFQKLLGNDLLVVGTLRHLYGMDPRTGEVKWRLRNVNSTDRDIANVSGASYILINDAAGGAFDDVGSHVIAVDRLDGAFHWETGVLRGRVLQAAIDYQREFLFAVTVQGAHGDDRGFFHDLLPGKGLFSGLKREPELTLIDLRDGTVRWQRLFGEEVELRPAERRGVGGAGAAQAHRPFDLGLYHPPTITGELVCVTYDGIACFRLSDGTPVWDQTLDVVDGDYGLSYPDPVVDREQLIVGDTKRLVAFSLDSGERRWRSEKLGRMAEVQEIGGILYVQMGGQFFDLDDERWEADGPFAALAVDKFGGNLIWDYDDLDDSISNLLVVDDLVWLADEDDLIALDWSTGEEIHRLEHDFEEPPSLVTLNKRQQVVVVSESEVAAFHRQYPERLWYQSYPPPRPGVWTRWSASLMAATGNVFRFSSTLIAYGGSLLPSMPNVVAGGTQLISGRRALREVTGYLGDTLTEYGSIGSQSGFANLSGNTQYFLTELDDEVALAAVDINAGRVKRLTILPANASQLALDEINGLIYQAEANQLRAVPLGR